MLQQSCYRDAAVVSRRTLMTMGDITGDIYGNNELLTGVNHLLCQLLLHDLASMVMEYFVVFPKVSDATECARRVIGHHVLMSPDLADTVPKSVVVGFRPARLEDVCADDSDDDHHVISVYIGGA